MNEVKTLSVRSIMAWISSIFFLLLGLGLFTEADVIGGVTMLVVGIILMPKFNQFILEKYKIKISAGIKVLIAFIGFIIFGSFANVDGQTAPERAQERVDEINQTQNEPKDPWSYREDLDPMTSTTDYFASVTSTNELDFEFPYNGGSTGTLTVRNVGEGNEVVLQISKGQFMMSFGDKSLTVRFDDKPPMTVGYNGTSDGSSDTIFLNSSQNLINNLKTAKKMLIEVEFYNEGNQILEFDVEGFKWDR
jgi:hypothetical protein